MTYAGARGETEKQMSQTLNFSLDQNTFHNDFGTLMDEIEKDSIRSLQLYIANSLWAQKDYKFLDSFFNLVKTIYKSELKNVNFKNKTKREKARMEINSWVEQKTKDKIKELVKEGINRINKIEIMKMMKMMKIMKIIKIMKNKIHCSGSGF